MAPAKKNQYDEVADEYSQTSKLPWAQLEAQYIMYALEDCSGLRVLDIGGGSGLQARRAVDAGAAVVDVVDVSAGMLKIGKDIESSLGRPGRINYHDADASQPFDFLNLEKSSYDIIIANWLLDCAQSFSDLEGMWENISAYAKPNGKFIGARMTKVGLMGNPCDKKYGVSITNVRDIPGGYRYDVTLHSEPETRFEGTSMEVSISGSTQMHDKYGFEDVRVIPAEQLELVKSDPEFWVDYLENPFYVAVVATASNK